MHPSLGLTSFKFLLKKRLMIIRLYALVLFSIIVMTAMGEVMQVKVESATYLFEDQHLLQVGPNNDLAYA